MVWLETTTVTVNGKAYDVLYLHVYLNASEDILQSGIIEGENKVSLDAGRNITMKDTTMTGVL